MDEIIIRNSRFSAVFGLIIFVPLMLIGIYLIVAVGGSTLMNWAITLLFASLNALCIFLYFDRRPRIVISADGISDRKLKVGTIDWRDISAVTLVRAGNMDFIQLKLFNAQKYRRKMSAFNKFTAKVDEVSGLDGVSINVSGVDRTPQDIGEIIVARMQHAQYQHAGF